MLKMNFISLDSQKKKRLNRKRNCEMLIVLSAKWCFQFVFINMFSLNECFSRATRNELIKRLFKARFEFTPVDEDFLINLFY